MHANVGVSPQAVRVIASTAALSRDGDDAAPVHATCAPPVSAPMAAFGKTLVENTLDKTSYSKSSRMPVRSWRTRLLRIWRPLRASFSVRSWSCSVTVTLPERSTHS